MFMKKIIFIMICMLTLVPLQGVKARTCIYNLQSPPIYYNGNWAYGKTYSFKTSASSCLAKNMFLYFKVGSSLYDMGFTIEAYLMENDADPNEDDKAKLYYGRNHQYTTDWSLIETYEGNLDSAGDQTCELYMKFRLKEPLAHNNTQYLNSNMFQYTICMD